jgi:hypothetical protein
VTAFGDRFGGCFGDSSVVFGLLDVERADLEPCYHRQDSGLVYDRLAEKWRNEIRFKLCLKVQDLLSNVQLLSHYIPIYSSNNVPHIMPTFPQRYEHPDYARGPDP